MFLKQKGLAFVLMGWLLLIIFPKPSKKLFFLK
jgi:hypothetical protein